MTFLGRECRLKGPTNLGCGFWVFWTLKLFLEDPDALMEMTTPETKDSKWPPATSHAHIKPIASHDSWKAFLELLQHINDSSFLALP